MDKKLLLALSAGLAVSLAGTPIANAETNPFEAQLIEYSSSNQNSKNSSGQCGASTDDSSYSDQINNR